MIAGVIKKKGSIWGVLALASLLALGAVFWPKSTLATSQRFVTVYHDGIEQSIVTEAKTVQEALDRLDISLTEYDSVEPTLGTELDAPGYVINVYRARPVTVVDGAFRQTVMTAHTSGRQIAEAAGLTLYQEDEFTLSRIDDFVGSAAVGLKLDIQRATPINLVLYGKPSPIRTQAKTVGDLLKERGLILGAKDGMNLQTATPITANMTLEIWRDGDQTVTEEQEVDFAVDQIKDFNKPFGFKEIRTPGTKGKKLVTYIVTMQGGKEVGRKELNSLVTQEPQKQVEVVGAKPGSGLSQSKGVNYFVDSKGVGHRETYYDLPMSGVMRACGGTYSVREDGAKIDQDGYILVAANLSRYPRCSIVETSLGLGKVYDTGGFVATYPDGFDLATDWSNRDGR